MTDPSPLEKAARALAVLDFNKGELHFAVSPADYAALLWRDYLPQARAVLEAVREPDKAIADAGEDAFRSADAGSCMEPAGPAFTAMIDAILSQGEGG